MILHARFDAQQTLPVLPMPPVPEQRLFFYPFDPVEADYDLSNKKLTLAPASVVGPQTERVGIRLGVNHLVIKVGLEPGALYRLTGIPMTELLQVEAFNGADLFGNEIQLLNEELRNAPGYLAMKEITELFLLKKLGKVKPVMPVDYALQVLQKSGGLAPIEKLAQVACTSTRNFERLVKERTGFSPKYYSRLVRFDRAWKLKESNPSSSWTSIAHECGYYDQMHLIKEFRSFYGDLPQKAGVQLSSSPFANHS